MTDVVHRVCVARGTLNHNSKFKYLLHHLLPLGPVSNICFWAGFSLHGASQVALVVKNPPANAGDAGSIPGLGRSPRGGHSNPLQYSCLENSMGKILENSWKIPKIPWNRTEDTHPKKLGGAKCGSKKAWGWCSDVGRDHVLWGFQPYNVSVLRHTQIHITPCQSTPELLVWLYFQFYFLLLPFMYSSSLLSPFPNSSVIKADFAHKGKKLTRLSHRWCTASCHQGLRPGTGCTLWGSRPGTGLPDRISSPGFSDSGHRPWWSLVESSHFCVLLPGVHSSASWKERKKKITYKREAELSLYKGCVHWGDYLKGSRSYIQVTFKNP